MNRNRNRRNKPWIANFRKGSFWRFVGRNRVKEIDLSQISDFSDIENNPAGINEIQKLVSQAGLAAASEARAVGIPKVFARGNEIIREFADGHIEVIIPRKQHTENTYFRHLKPRILHARKK